MDLGARMIAMVRTQRLLAQVNRGAAMHRRQIRLLAQVNRGAAMHRRQIRLLAVVRRGQLAHRQARLARRQRRLRLLRCVRAAQGRPMLTYLRLAANLGRTNYTGKHCDKHFVNVPVMNCKFTPNPLQHLTSLFSFRN